MKKKDNIVQPYTVSFFLNDEITTINTSLIDDETLICITVKYNYIR